MLNSELYPHEARNHKIHVTFIEKLKRMKYPADYASDETSLTEGWNIKINGVPYKLVVSNYRFLTWIRCSDKEHWVDRLVGAHSNIRYIIVHPDTDIGYVIDKSRLLEYAILHRDRCNWKNVKADRGWHYSIDVTDCIRDFDANITIDNPVVGTINFGEVR